MSVRILEGDALTVLRTLPDQSVQMCCTSPPYWGLRDYGIAGQIGLERTPEEYVGKLVAVFQEVKRVLRDDGTLWLNIGDSYAARGNSGGNGGITNVQSSSIREKGWRPPPKGMKDKDLVGIPWMVAFALRGDGWYLRQEIIWHKPNPMPESVTDRCTKSHEHIFLLSKKRHYYFDADAIREEAVAGWRGSSFTDERDLTVRPNTGRKQRKPAGWDTGAGGHGTFHRKGRAEEIEYTDVEGGGRNRRSVWTIPTQPFAAAHFATFPPKLAEPCILAGSKKGDTVLDAFGGAGTTALVSDRLGRDAVIIELKPEYAQLSRERIHSDNPLFGDVA